jgi:hypothetical protein
VASQLDPLVLERAREDQLVVLAPSLRTYPLAELAVDLGRGHGFSVAGQNLRE